MRTIAVALALGFFACGPLAAPASAAQTLYVSPTGLPLSACTPTDPCDVVTAVNILATSGDTVVLAGDQGTYGTPGTPITTQLADAGGVDVHGAAGQPMPVIYSNVAANNAIISNPGSSISYLHVENLAANGSGVFVGGTAVQLLSRAPGTGCQPNVDAMIIDSVCAGGGFGIGTSVGTAGSHTLTLRNVTADATTSYGLFLDASGFNWTVNAGNVIARGPFRDIQTSQSSGGTITMTLDHSNYSSNISQGAGTTITPAGSGANQTANPLFVNAAAGDFHQSPTSPTIDHGSDSIFNGFTDFEGDPRILGASTDIGADEYVPPAPPAPPAQGAGNPTSPINPAGHLRKRKCKKKHKSAAVAKKHKCKKRKRK